ncbi:MAG: M3 family metallopeptidase, partial [Oscillospiraceae bacterium]|nr:M3 family metallopeptidase [Oscillospiraceae bacterium]
MKFSEVPYTRPNLEDTLAAYDKLIAAAQNAACDTALLEVFDDYQALNATLETAATLASIRHTINTNDSFYEAENDFFDEAGPVISDKKLALYGAFLKSAYVKALDEKYGAFLRQKMELDVKSASPEIIALMQQENAMETQYQKLYASAKIPFEGKICTVPQMSLYKQSPDRAVRKAAYEAEGKFFDDNREALDTLYDKLVKNRTAQAKALGFESYTPLGYIRMKRMGYSRADVESYRKQVVESVVPFVCGLKRAAAERIGVTDFKFYDDIFRFKDGNAAPEGTPEEILAAGKKMYQELSPETAAFIEEMFAGDLFDVLSKAGKAPGGYCTYIPALKMPFIFSNFNA